MFDKKALAELGNALASDQKKADDAKRDMLKLAQDVILRDELLREGHDLLNVILLKTGVIFKLNDYGDLLAKAKAWNLRVRSAGIIKIVSGKAG